MSSVRWDDDALLEELRAAFAEPPVPPHVLAAAQAAYSWRTVDDELAAMVFDSALAGAGGLRGGSGRALVFETGELSVELEVDPERIVGQLVPPQPGRVTLSTPTGPYAETTADEVGCFVVARPASGEVRLSVRAEDGQLATDWLQL